MSLISSYTPPAPNYLSDGGQHLAMLQEKVFTMLTTPNVYEVLKNGDLSLADGVRVFSVAFHPATEPCYRMGLVSDLDHCFSMEPAAGTALFINSAKNYVQRLNISNLLKPENDCPPLSIQVAAKVQNFLSTQVSLIVQGNGGGSAAVAAVVQGNDGISAVQGNDGGSAAAAAVDDDDEYMGIGNTAEEAHMTDYNAELAKNGVWIINDEITCEKSFNAAVLNSYTREEVMGYQAVLELEDPPQCPKNGKPMFYKQTICSQLGVKKPDVYKKFVPFVPHVHRVLRELYYRMDQAWNDAMVPDADAF